MWKVKRMNTARIVVLAVALGAGGVAAGVQDAVGVVAALAGVALTAQIGAADPSNGPSYLIPAFSAAFLGATQFRRGRFNPWGTILAVLMLTTGSIGLLLVGAPQWSPQVFQGAVLIAAVGLGGLRRHRDQAA